MKPAEKVMLSAAFALMAEPAAVLGVPRFGSLPEMLQPALRFRA